jgi:AraC family transcriptional regulator, ethanolamine operon transcriptional activator
MPSDAEFCDMPDLAMRWTFAEAHDLSAKWRGMVVNAVPLRPGYYTGTLSTIELGDITLQVVRSKPMLVLGASAERTAGLVQVLEGADRARWNGRSLDTNAIAICGYGRQHEAAYPDDFACTVLSFSTGSDSALQLPVDPSPRPGGPGVILHADPDAYSALATIAGAFEQEAARSSSVLYNTEARRSLHATVLDAVRGLLAPAGITKRRDARDAGGRQRLVRKADEYLRANPARPIYADDLCTAVDASATCVHQAFHLTFGISPQRYLKMRRMAMVRAELLSPTGPWHSVKAAALSCGFWHLGQFAHEYRFLYAESPSETLARALPRDLSGFAPDDPSGRPGYR